MSDQLLKAARQVLAALDSAYPREDVPLGHVRTLAEAVLASAPQQAQETSLPPQGAEPTSQDIQALIAELQRMEDPQQCYSPYRALEQKDIRAWCGSLWRALAASPAPAQPMTSGEMNVLANTHGFARGDAALLNLMRDVEERCGVTGGRRYTNTDGSVTPLNATPAPQEPAAEPDHELKTWPPFFEDVLSGRKTFEVRKNDRGFAVGHVVRLNEWAPDKGYTGRFVDKRITYMLTGPQFGIEAGYSVLALYASPAPGELGAASAKSERLTELLSWCYAKLHYRSFDSMEDALVLDEIKMLLEHGQ